MQALVTGGAGFIGSAVARELIASGIDVRVLDNLSTGSRDRVPTRAEFLEGDLRDPDAVAVACRDVEVVFHQGALRSVPRSMDEPSATNDSNVTGTLNLLRAAAASGVRRVVYASSSSVYGDSDTQPLSEDLSPQPLSPYAVSKLAAEYYCRAWSQSFGLSTVSLRYFNVFGPGQPPDSKYAAVFPAFISALIGGHAPEIYWDGGQTRDFTFIDDVVRANIAAANVGPAGDGQVFNIGSGRPQSVIEVLRAVSVALGRWVDPEMKPMRPGDVRDTHADNSKAGTILGWHPEVDWSEAVALTVGWFVQGAPSREALSTVGSGAEEGIPS